jgi:hypothetical protein
MRSESKKPIPFTEYRSRREREGRVQLPFWVSRDARRQLRQIALDEDTTAQDLLVEALNLFFRDRGKPPIA